MARNPDLVLTLSLDKETAKNLIIIPPDGWIVLTDDPLIAEAIRRGKQDEGSNAALSEITQTHPPTAGARLNPSTIL